MRCLGEANDWGGAESIGSDVEMVDDAETPHAAPSPLEPTDFQVVPTRPALPREVCC